MDITQFQVEQLSRLARLTLTREEGEELTGRLAQMVGYLHALSQVEEGAEGNPPAAVSFRPDEVHPSLDGDKLLTQAPGAADGYVVTPRSVGEGEQG